jgi:hypothetical protein
VIVHLNVADEPEAKPVTVVLFKAALVIVAEPDCNVHSPVPVTGTLPANVKLELLHWSMSVPATATVTAASLVKITTLELVHVPFVIVQRNVALVPEGTPVTVVTGDVKSVIVAVPLTKVHPPVPTKGVLADNVKVELLH